LSANYENSNILFSLSRSCVKV